MSRLSAKHALTPQEVEFCKYYAASGIERIDLCYQRAFLILRPGDPSHGISRCWVEPNVPMQSLTAAQRIEVLNALPEVTKMQIVGRAREKLKDPMIQRYLEELTQSPITVAEQVLLEQAQLGDEKDARGAAVKILELDQRSNRRDDIFFLAQVLDEAGFEVVVELPQEVRRDVTCPECGHTRHMAFPVEAVGKFVAPKIPMEDANGTDG